MAEIHGRLGPLLACHVIQRAAPQLNPGMLAPGPARLRPPGGRSRPAHGGLPIPGPSRPGRHPTSSTHDRSVRSR
jgi:hypothetical protein